MTNAPTALIGTAAPAARLSAAGGAPSRLVLLGRSAVVLATSITGALLFSLWITAVALSPLTLLAPLLLPATSCVRAYANRYRRSVRALLGVHVEQPYRARATGGAIARAWALLRDPASWRDAWWLLAHTLGACTSSALSLGLFAGGIFYLIYPLLYWVTPEQVFAGPLGSWQLHSVAQSTLVMPLAAVAFGLWYLLAVPLARAEGRLTRALLSPRVDRTRR